METVGFLVSVIFVLLGLVFLQYYWQRWPVKQFPPGPFGYPFIGSALNIKRPFQLWLWELSKKYGDVYSLPLNSGKATIVLSGWETIKSALLNSSNAFSSRMEGAYTVSLYNPELKGIFDASFTSAWQKHRHFAHTTLRGFGFGKVSFEGKIIEEAKKLIDHLKEHESKSQYLESTLLVCVSNITYNITFGYKFELNDKQVRHLMDVIFEWSQTTASDAYFLLNGIPIARPFMQKRIKHIKSCRVRLLDFVTKEVREHIATFQPESSPRDFIDCYIAKMKKHPDDFTINDLSYDLVDILVAGAEPIATTLNWAFLFMVINPDVQEKVHQELIKVVGLDRLPCLTDRENLPYTLAVIREIQRLACIVPIIPRCTTADTTIGGCNIPKGTDIYCNAWTVHYSPELWPEPDRFDPHRHLNDDGELVRNHSLLSFGLGRRGCMGEQLAKIELFLIFSILLHRFKFEIPPGAEKPTLVGKLHLNLTAQPYEVVFTEYD